MKHCLRILFVECSFEINKYSCIIEYLMDSENIDNEINSGEYRVIRLEINDDVYQMNR